MAVIWGLDLKEITWSKFGHRNMWNNRHHLRRTKFLVYQLAMILCVISESLGTAALTDYVDQQEYIERFDRKARVHNNDFVGAASYNIFVGIYVATIFGSGFFFDLIWPERHESRAVKLAWKICSLLACLFALSSALAITIITTTSRARITGVDAATARADIRASGEYPLEYSENGLAVASVVLEWAGFLATVAATVVMWMSQRHDKVYGPLSTHARMEELEQKAGVGAGVGGAVDSVPATAGGEESRGSGAMQTEASRYEGV